MTALRVGGVPEHFNLPWHFCIDNDEFTDVGLNVSWRDFNGGTGAMCKALRHKEIDIAVILTEGIIRDISAGNPSKIIQEYIGSPLLWGIHVAQNSPYNTIDDLENTTCAISRYGSGSHLLAYVNAQNEGWNTSQLDFEVVNDLQGALTALPKNDAQYFLWEHYTTKPFVDNGVFRRLGDCPTPWPCFVIVARDEIIEKNKVDLQHLLEVLNRTTREFKSIPMISKTLSNVYNQKEEDIKDWLTQTTWSQAQVSKSTVSKVQNQLQSLQLIDTQLAYSELCFDINK